MRDGATFPAPTVFIDPTTELFRVGDGFHRIMAAKHNHEKSIEVNLKRGGYREAFLYCIETNRDQRGLPFSTGDKERCITTLLRDEETRKWTLTRIAETVGCTAGYASVVASKLKKLGEERPGIVFDRNGIPRSLPITKDRKVVAKRREKAFKLLQGGVAKIEISRQLGISRAAVQRYIKDAIEHRALVPCPHCGGSGWMNERQANFAADHQELAPAPTSQKRDPSRWIKTRRGRRPAAHVHRRPSSAVSGMTPAG
jgi:hypothetical protein